MGKKFFLILFILVFSNSFEITRASDLSIDDFELLGPGEEEVIKPVRLVINGDDYVPKRKRKTILGRVVKALKSVTGSLLESSMIRNTLAWGITYYSMGAVEEGLSVGASGVGTFLGGPGAGSASYYTVKGTFKAVRWFGVGADKGISWLFTPITRKLVVDPVLGGVTLLFLESPKEEKEKEKTS